MSKIRQSKNFFQQAFHFMRCFSHSKLVHAWNLVNWIRSGKNTFPKKITADYYELLKCEQLRQEDGDVFAPQHHFAVGGNTTIYICLMKNSFWFKNFLQIKCGDITFCIVALHTNWRDVHPTLKTNKEKTLPILLWFYSVIH